MFDPSTLYNNILIIAGVAVVILFIRSGIGQKLIDSLGGLATVRKEIVTEQEAEIVKLKLEMKTVTSELRQAREFADEDRRIIRTLRSRCRRYVIEINQRRITDNVQPILAGSEGDDE